MILRAKVKLALLVLSVVLAPAAAHAADNTRYVSVSGSNANACTLAAPCRTLQRSINVTPAGGELRILDSGSYGNNANIKKSLTISGNGHTVYLGGSIIIDQTDAVVTLRGLVLDGQGAIANGIGIVAAATVHIERCVVHGYTEAGVFATGAGINQVFVSDSIMRDNGNGLFISNAATLQLTIDNSRFENNFSNGVGVSAGGRATITRSVLSGNKGNCGLFSSAIVSVMSTVAGHNDNGFCVLGVGRTLTVESSLAHGNEVGVLADLSATARISNSTVTGNGTGVLNNSTVETRSNNIIRGNTDDFDGNALTPIGGD